MKMLNKITDIVANLPVILAKGAVKGAKAIQATKQPRDVKPQISEEESVIKPTKWRQEAIPDYTVTKPMSSQFAVNKREIAKQKKSYGLTETQEKSINPLGEGIYFKLNQPGSIPESPYLQFLGYSRIDGMPLYVYYGDDISYYTGIYNIEEIHNL